MTPATSLLLVRHGEVEQAYQHVFGGRIDMNLSPRGHDQAEAIAHYLTRFRIDAIYASPLRRARQTSAALERKISTQATVLDALQEVDFGDWTGLHWNEVFERFQRRASHWLHLLETQEIPNAEHAPIFRRRVEPCIQQLLGEHPSQTIAVVCHGGVIRMALAALLDLPLSKMSSFEVDYASLTHVEVSSQRGPEVRLLNFAPWLHAHSSPR